MKNTRTRSAIITIITFLFILGLIFLGYNLVVNSNQWALKPSNSHLNGSGVADLGTIYDKNEVILAQSKDGKRVYNEDADVRKAVLHTVGDDTTFISTAIQNVYRSELSGYNFILGLNAPDFVKKSSDIKLTIDSALCKKALNELGDRKGAVSVYNYKTGEIVCMVSTPTYDPESPPDFESDLEGKYEGAYLNRVLSASYTPGSTFKVITGACAIDNISDVEDKSFECHQKENVDGQNITCMEYHGNIKFNNAMADSCNIYFADLAMELGKNKMTTTTEKLGFNKSFEINKIKLQKSHYDVSKATTAGLGWSGMGQYETLVNPMHMTMIMGAIANSGIPVMPNMVSSINSSTGKKNMQTQMGERMLKTSTAAKLKDTMRYTVKNNSSYSVFDNLSVCAKTGTAEVGKDKEPHGWVVGFSIDEEIPYAFAVIVENGGFGSRCAAPIAASLLRELKEA